MASQREHMFVAPSSAFDQSKGKRRSTPPTHAPTKKASTPSGRVSHACDRCRLMRTKCSGGERCSKCIKDDAICEYGDRKRERNKKDLIESLDRIVSLEEENSRLVKLLHRITERPHFQVELSGDVMRILRKYGEQTGYETDHASSIASWSLATSPMRNEASTARSQSQISSMERDASCDTKTSPGRAGELRHVVDLDAGSGAAGYIGKLSEISWIQRAFEIIQCGSEESSTKAIAPEMDGSVTKATNFSYFMDDTNVLAIDEDYVDQYHWPPAKKVVILSEAFFHATQGAFHFVLREQFLQEAFSSYGKKLIGPWRKRHWLAFANLAWAIGAKWLEVTKMNDETSKDDHLVYYARARALGLDHRVMSDHPDIGRVQSIGALAFYLLINGSITRARNTLGHAIRHATALGLHLRVTDSEIGKSERARRARTIYSLYSLEIMLAEITGRPKSISLPDLSLSIDDFRANTQAGTEYSNDAERLFSPEQSREIWHNYLSAKRNVSQMTRGIVQRKTLTSVSHGILTKYFPQRLYLCRLSDKIATQLYSGTSEDSWPQTQLKINELRNELCQWAENLPQDLVLQDHVASDTDPRAKIELSMYYHSVSMILYRPCLCEVIIDNESPQSREFNLNASRACVYAAMSLLELIPDYLTAHEAYQLLPWWSLLHFVSQAAAVLLLELSLGSQHCRDEVQQIVNHLRKAMWYLRCMSEESLSAFRATTIFTQLLTEVMRRHDNLDFSDILIEAPPLAGAMFEYPGAETVDFG